MEYGMKAMSLFWWWKFFRLYHNGILRSWIKAKAAKRGEKVPVNPKYMTEQDIINTKS